MQICMIHKGSISIFLQFLNSLICTRPIFSCKIWFTALYIKPTNDMFKNLIFQLFLKYSSHGSNVTQVYL